VDVKLQVMTAVAFATMGLSACSTMHTPMSGAHGANTEQRCAMYRSEMEGKSAAEQRAAAEAHITAMHGSSDAAHVDRHLRMMNQMCGVKSAGSNR
jgi:hypothetical protein